MVECPCVGRGGNTRKWGVKKEGGGGEWRGVGSKLDGMLLDWFEKEIG